MTEQQHHGEDATATKGKIHRKSRFPLFLTLLAGTAIIAAGGWYVYNGFPTPHTPQAIATKPAPITKVKSFFRENGNPLALWRDFTTHIHKEDSAALKETSPREGVMPFPSTPGTTPPPPPKPDMVPPPSPALEHRLHHLEGRMHFLSDNINNEKKPIVNHAGNKNDIVLMQLESLQEKVALLQQEQQAQKSRFNQRLRAITLLDQLEGEVLSGYDSGDTIARLMQIAPHLGLEEEPLLSLRKAAEDTPPSLAMLMEDFTSATRRAAPFAGGETQGFTARLQEALAPVITIRRVDVEPSDASDEAHIARAEAELKAGNVDMALTHLRQLSPRTSPYYDAWVTGAEQFQSVIKTVQSLKTAIHQPE